MKKNNIIYCKESAMFLPTRQTLVTLLSSALFAGTFVLSGADVASLKKKAEDPAAAKKKAEILAAGKQRMLAETAITQDELAKSVNYLFSSAAAEYQKGNFRQAIESALKASELLRGKDGSRTLTFEETKILERLRSLLGKSYYYIALDLFHKAEKSAVDGKYNEAIRYSDEAIANYPPCKEIMQQMKSKYEKLRENSVKLKAGAAHTRDIMNHVDNPDEEKRELTIAREMRVGQNFYKIGKWDRARDHFNAVLRQDPYNEAAIDYLRKCYERLLEAGRRRKNVMTLERLAEVAWSSVSPVLTAVDDELSHQVRFKAQAKVNTTKNIETKLKQIRIPSLTFEGTPLSKAIKRLRELSQEHDIDKNGVNILLLRSHNVAPVSSKNAPGGAEESLPGIDGLDAPAAAPAAGSKAPAAASDTSAKDPIIERLKVSNMDLYTILQHVKNLTHMKLYIEPNAVIFADPNVPFEDYILDVFVIEKQSLDNMINSAGKGGGGGAAPAAGGGGGKDGKTSAINSEEAARNNEAVKRYFEQNVGIPFPPGTSVRVEYGVSRIIVKNTAENNAMIGQKIKQLDSTETLQVLSQVKFVEVSMNDLEELGFEYVVSRQNDGSHTIAYEPINTNFQSVVDPTTGNVSTENVPYVADESFTLVYKPTYSSSSSTVLNGVEVTNPITGSGAIKTEVIEKGSKYVIPTDGVYYKAPLNLTSIFGSSVTFGANNTLVRNAQTSTSAFSPTGIVTNDTVMAWSHRNKKGYDVDAKMHALDQADSTDILSAPRITTISGQAAVIRMVTEKYYPEEWEKAELETVSGEGDNDDIPVFQPSVPTFGDATEEGIVLSIHPTVENNDTITIPMTPTIQEFAGWTDYSYQIPLESNNETRYYPNTLKMPIIEQRQINTVVVTYDGKTVVMGGVLRDRITMVEDQYPILGDIPLIGRLFQSKGRGSEKVSLLIFLNSRLIKPDGSPYRANLERENGVPAFRY